MCKKQVEATELGPSGYATSYAQHHSQNSLRLAKEKNRCICRRKCLLTNRRRYFAQRENEKKREKQRVVVRHTRLGFYVPFEAHLPSQPLIGAFNCAVRSQRQGATVLLVFKMTCDKASFVREYRLRDVRERRLRDVREHRLRDVQERRLMDVQERRLRDVVRTRESCCGRRTPGAFGTLHWPCVTVRFLSDDSPVLTRRLRRSTAVRCREPCGDGRTVSQVFFTDVLRLSCT